ncbi:unnamed protein product [Cladocopium goreaui]|uniref:Uncharacterized protein n=1 Tax=Cladocopium goreaui TaxID=2562237 RepID=A0A9P1BK69_9DINO|nr:unnamed protein product [Cladocopium goreaui]
MGQGGQGGQAKPASPATNLQIRFFGLQKAAAARRCTKCCLHCSHRSDHCGQLDLHWEVVEGAFGLGLALHDLQTLDHTR